MKIELFDTTLRDGTQGEHISLSAQDKLRIAQRLDAFGIDVIEGGWPGSNPKDRAFFELARDVDWQHAQLCAFGATRHPRHAPEDDPNLQALLAVDTPVVSLFGKSWTLHVDVALGVTREENLDLIASSVAYLKAHGRRVIYDAEHFFDGYAADAAYALATLDAAAGAGADVLVLCDTNGGTLPAAIYDVVRTVKAHTGVPLGIHTHDDGACAVANTLMAVRAGAVHVQGTIGGLGERCGNADLCAVVPGLQLKMGHACVAPEQLAALTELAHFVADVANVTPATNSAYVGPSAFAHKGGIHVSAVMKAPAAYEHLAPETVGNRRRVLLSELSGRSNLRYLAEQYGVADASDEETAAVVARIKELEHQGYAFEGADASCELLLRRTRGEALDFFALDRLRVRTEMDAAGHRCSEATLAVQVAGQRRLGVAEGQGPVDALSKALHQILAGFYPHLADVHLADYKVRVVNPECGTAAAVRVLVAHTDGRVPWHTVGVSHDILQASWQAVADGLRYYLLHHAPAPVHPVAGPGRRVPMPTPIGY